MAKTGEMAQHCRSTTPPSGSWHLARTGIARLLGYSPCGCMVAPQNYHQTFSSIAADRNSESLTNIQYVPVQQMGLLAQWSKQLASRFTLLAGLDALDVQGFSNETSYSSGRVTAQLSNGGTQQSLGAFLEGILQITRKWSVTSREEKTCGATWTPVRAVFQ